MTSDFQYGCDTSSWNHVDGGELLAVDGGLTSALVVSGVTLDQMIYQYQGCFKLDLKVEPILR